MSQRYLVVGADFSLWPRQHHHLLRIEVVPFTDGQLDPFAPHRVMSVAEAVSLLHTGMVGMATWDGQTSARVVTFELNGRWWLRTERDGIASNNLLSLRPVRASAA